MPNTLPLFLMETKLTVADNIQYNLRFSEKICRLIIKIISFGRYQKLLHQNGSFFIYKFRKEFIINFVLMGEK